MVTLPLCAAEPYFPMCNLIPPFITPVSAFLKNSVITKQEVFIKDNQVEGEKYLAEINLHRGSKMRKENWEWKLLLIWLHLVGISRVYL